MFVTVNDGTKIHIIEAGEGIPLILLPGGGFSNDIFKYQIDYFSKHFKVLAVSMRAHGKSDSVKYGMRLSRLAKDLKDIIDFLQLENIHIMAHSLGCSVIYSFLDLFLENQFQKMILIDEAVVLTENPIWTEKEKLNYGATYKTSENYNLLNQMLNENFDALKQKMVSAMMTDNAPKAAKEFIENCFEISPQAAALLYHDNLNHDWRDIVPRITIPTLFIGGRRSITPWQSQQWLNQQVKNSELKIFEENEGGNHFMFVENYSLFNQIALSFLANTPT